MRTAFVTGATGFVGLNLIERLRAEGWTVTAFHRKGSDVSLLTPLGADLVVGELTDARSVAAVMPERLDAVFHLAGDTNFWRLANDAQTRTHVNGTRAVCAAALERGARRFIHTSSIVAWGNQDGQHVTEKTVSNAEGHWFNYARTKWLAEVEVRHAVARGLDAVILNPCNIIGPYDRAGVARLFRLIPEGKVPGLGPGQATWCHVKDVVAAHIAAVERGRTGENYLLGGPTATLVEVGNIIAEITGARPLRTLPGPLLRIFGRLSEWFSYVSRRPPDLTPEVAELSCARWSADSSKARAELGYTETPLREALEDSHAWLTKYARERGAAPTRERPT